jgi:hypothetical protein
LKIIKNNQLAFCQTLAIFLLLIFINGCAVIDKMGKATPPQREVINNALPFIDVPVPSGFIRDQSKSFVYETGNEHLKVGRLFFEGNKSLKDVVEFYRNEMINKEWSLINSMASKNTILNYRKTGWTCAVIVRPRSFSRSNIEIQIGPVQTGSK